MKTYLLLQLHKSQNLVSYLWILPAAGTVWIILAYSAQVMGLDDRVQKAIDRYLEMEKQASQTASAPDQSLMAGLTKSLFAAQAQQPQMPQCTAIMGQLALFGSKWLKVGDEMDGAKILAIGTRDVTIQWQGAEQTVAPFNVTMQYGTAGGRQGGDMGRRRFGGDMGGMGSMGGMGGGMRSFGPPNFGPSMMTPEAFEQARETFRQMDPEQRRQMRDRFFNMSPEERQAAIDNFQQTGRIPTE